MSSNTTNTTFTTEKAEDDLEVRCSFSSKPRGRVPSSYGAAEYYIMVVENSRYQGSDKGDHETNQRPYTAPIYIGNWSTQLDSPTLEYNMGCPSAQRLWERFMGIEKDVPQIRYPSNSDIFMKKYMQGMAKFTKTETIIEE